MRVEHGSCMTKQQCTEKLSQGHIWPPLQTMVVSSQGLCHLLGDVDGSLHTHELLDSKEGDHLLAQQQLQQRLPAIVQVHHVQKRVRTC